MDETTRAVLLALIVLQVKHFICDFVLQTPYQIHGKGIYGHPGGLLHAGLHGLGSLLVFIVMPAPLGIAAALIAAEMVLHYHIDWAKEQVLRRLGWTASGSRYWIVTGADQLLHGLTYIAMVAVLAVVAG